MQFTLSDPCVEHECDVLCAGSCHMTDSCGVCDPWLAAVFRVPAS
jgi:hypothetical protein